MVPSLPVSMPDTSAANHDPTLSTVPVVCGSSTGSREHQLGNLEMVVSLHVTLFFAAYLTKHHASFSNH